MMAEKFSEFSVINIWCTSARLREREAQSVLNISIFQVLSINPAGTSGLPPLAWRLWRLAIRFFLDFPDQTWAGLASGLVWPGWVCQFIFFRICWNILNQRLRTSTSICWIVPTTLHFRYHFRYNLITGGYYSKKSLEAYSSLSVGEELAPKRKIFNSNFYFQCHCGHINCPCCNLLINLEITDPNILQ